MELALQRQDEQARGIGRRAHDQHLRHGGRRQDEPTIIDRQSGGAHDRILGAPKGYATAALAKEELGWLEKAAGDRRDLVFPAFLALGTARYIAAQAHHKSGLPLIV